MRFSKYLLSVFLLLSCRYLTAEITGHVYDRSQNPVPGARVVLKNIAKADLLFDFVTDNNGLFSTDSVPNGVYWLEATAEGFRPYERTPFDIHFPRGFEVGIYLEPENGTGRTPDGKAEVWGELNGSSGPLAGAKVCLSPESKNSERSCTVTNRLGQYSLRVTPGPYNWSVLWMGEVQWEGAVSLDEAKEYPDPMTLE